MSVFEKNSIFKYNDTVDCGIVGLLLFPGLSWVRVQEKEINICYLRCPTKDGNYTRHRRKIVKKKTDDTNACIGDEEDDSEVEMSVYR